MTHGVGVDGGGGGGAVATTACVRALEVLEALLASPTYTAVIGCAPRVSAAVVKVHVPPLRVQLPICAPASSKFTVRVGLAPVTVVENVTALPVSDGLGLLVSVVVVAAGLTVRVAACVDVLADVFLNTASYR